MRVDKTKTRKYSPAYLMVSNRYNSKIFAISLCVRYEMNKMINTSIININNTYIIIICATCYCHKMCHVNQNIKISKLIFILKKNRLLTLGQISAIAARWIGGICLQ